MQKYTRETSVGIFVFIGLICVAYLTIKLGKLEFFDDGMYDLQARFSSVSGLHAGAEVEIAGVPVGKVSTITLDQERVVAVVVMSIQDDVVLDDETFASVKTSGIIGDKYINLSPGGGLETLKEGDVIINTEPSIDLEALISKYVFGDI